jgi:hypothetical protein
MDTLPTDVALAQIAQEMAEQYGCIVARWWRDEHDPQLLYIEATNTQLKAKQITLQLVMLLTS